LTATEIDGGQFFLPLRRMRMTPWHNMDLTHYLVMVVFWLAIIGGGIGLLAVLFPPGETGTETTENAGNAITLSILKERLAQGEISTAEYAEICRRLHLSNTGSA